MAKAKEVCSKPVSLSFALVRMSSTAFLVPAVSQLRLNAVDAAWYGLKWGSKS